MSKIFSVVVNGKTYTSKLGFELISDEQHKEILDLWYKKPPIKDVLLEMAQLRRGGTAISLITEYFFRDLMDNTTKYYDKWSINEVLQNKELLSIFVDKINKNKKVFNSNSIIENIDTAFRLGGKGIASKVSQFPVKTACDILQKYNVNNNWYDFSCGWGGRLSSALKKNVNYFGTDPNYLLVDRLNEFSNQYKKTQMSNTLVEIRCQGSEVFVPEWENKMGLAFSSPPYFLLEDYKIGKQSYKEGVSYDSWINGYLSSTMKNINRYLIDDGFFIINIKDFAKYPLEQDTISQAQKNGFYLFKIERLNQSKRASGSTSSSENNEVDVDENIYVFAKNGCVPKEKVCTQFSLFDV